jgi:catechol-2,3-dioxygenase
MKIDAIDHIVLTGADIAKTAQFYKTILDIKIVVFANDRTALTFSQQKINLHQQNNEFKPNASVPTPGNADFYLITLKPLNAVVQHFIEHQILIEEAPIKRTGACGDINSIYTLYPNQNSLKISNYSN